MKSIETTGKTAEQAIELGLYKLGAKRDEVKIEILKQATLFDKAIVRISLNTSSEEENNIKELVDKILNLMDLDLEVYVEERENDFFVNITGNDTALFIGKRGESIEEFQILLNAIYNKDKARDEMKRLTVDSNKYIEKRVETLTRLAKKTASNVIRSRRDFKFEPMNAYERRIIHTALSEHDKVVTESYGNEPNRYIMVKLKTNLQKPKNYDEEKDYFEDDTIAEAETTPIIDQEQRVDND
ncbi:MAG: KH domain-containing protein [Clostridia bacterium]|nr:KH domain-containing protein [Clostridia bacterium]